MSELSGDVLPDGAFVGGAAEVLFEDGGRADADAVAEGVAIVEPLDEPVFGWQFAAVGGIDAVVAAAQRRVAKHWRRREGIDVAPNKRDDHIRGEEQAGGGEGDDGAASHARIIAAGDMPGRAVR
jgi:hypothetical protein